jgi:hypothetical protein
VIYCQVAPCSVNLQAVSEEKTSFFRNGDEKKRRQSFPGGSRGLGRKEIYNSDPQNYSLVLHVDTVTVLHNCRWIFDNRVEPWAPYVYRAALASSFTINPPATSLPPQPGKLLMTTQSIRSQRLSGAIELVRNEDLLLVHSRHLPHKIRPFSKPTASSGHLRLRT